MADLFNFEINIGNLIVLATALFAGVAGYTRLTERSVANRERIQRLEADLERRSVEAAKVCAEDLERAESRINAAIEVVHHRYDKYQREISDSINALTIEMRAMHAENSRFRENVAKEYIPSAYMQTISGDLAAIRDRIDKMVDKKGSST